MHFDNGATEFTGLFRPLCDFYFWRNDKGTLSPFDLPLPVSPVVLESRSALVRILVADDNPAVRRYLRAILEQQNAWRVCGDARTGEETLDRARALMPDLILLDFQMPDLNGLEVAQHIRRLAPATPILMVTIHMSKRLTAAAKAVGIRGICAKSDIGSIVEAVRKLLQEGTYFPPTDTRGVSFRGSV